MLVIDPPDRLSMSVSQSALSLIPISQTRKPTEDHLLSPDGQSRRQLYSIQSNLKPGSTVSIIMMQIMEGCTKKSL